MNANFLHHYYFHFLFLFFLQMIAFKKMNNKYSYNKKYKRNKNDIFLGKFE